jgi:hypothetical protein
MDWREDSRRMRVREEMAKQIKTGDSIMNGLGRTPHTAWRAGIWTGGGIGGISSSAPRSRSNPRN